MKIESEFLKAKYCRGFKRVLKTLVLGAYADEGGSESTPAEPVSTPEPQSTKGSEPAPAPTYNFENLIAQARKEEKDKLYPKIKKLEKELQVMTKSNNNNLLEVARLKDELAAAKSVDESEVVKGLKTELKKVKQEFEDFKKNTTSEEELRSILEKEYEVKAYLSEQKLSKKNEVLPMFLDMIVGETKEDIDASVQKAIEMTNKAKEELGAVSNSQKPNSSHTPVIPPVVNPNGGISKDSLNIDFIRNMDIRSKEYADWRKSQGLK